MEQASPSLPLPLPPYKDRRGWLVAFGVAELLLGLLWLLMAIFSAIVLPSVPKPPGQESLAGGVIYFPIALYFIIAVFLIFVAIGSMRARNWARIAMLTASWLWLVIGVLSTLTITLVMPVILRQQQAALPQDASMPAGFEHTVLVVSLIFVASAMIVMPLIFILFYSGRNVRATCLASTPSDRSSNRLPTPLVVAVIWLTFSCVAGIATSPWAPYAVFFGVVVKGISAKLIIAAYGLVSGYAAWGFYKRYLAGWRAGVGMHIFGLLSGVISLRLDLFEVARENGLGPDPRIMPFSSGWFTSIMVAAFAVNLGLLIFLVYTKRYFNRTGSLTPEMPRTAIP